MSGTNERVTPPEAETFGELRGFALAGVTGPVVFWVVVFVLGFLTPGYSPVADYISTLGEVGAPYAIVQQLNFVVLGVSILALALGLHRFTRGHGRPSLGVALLGTLGVTMVLVAVFSQNSADPASTTNVLHESFAIGGFIAGIVGITLVSRQLDRDERWTRHRFSTPATAILLVVPFFGVPFSPESLVGLTQRLFVAVWTGWVAYHSFRLYRMTEPE